MLRLSKLLELSRDQIQTADMHITHYALCTLPMQAVSTSPRTLLMSSSSLKVAALAALVWTHAALWKVVFQHLFADAAMYWAHNQRIFEEISNPNRAHSSSTSASSTELQTDSTNSSLNPLFQTTALWLLTHLHKSEDQVWSDVNSA